MPTLITLEDLSIGFLCPPLLDNVTCRVESGQRIGLLGRNGAGKTTLMKIINGMIEPDSGQCRAGKGVRISFLTQDVPQDLTGPAGSVVAAGISGDQPDWKKETLADEILTRMGLAKDLEVSSLSSGMKRRVLLARAVVDRPDVLLLDEPTNHLDIESIDWLEQFLLSMSSSLMFVTHDRVFLRNIATRILEIDRGRLFDWTCDYDTFLKRKSQALAAEEKTNALFDKRLAEEEAWIRQGIKARRTRNEGRVRALVEMRRERQDRREKTGVSSLKIQEAGKSGRLVVQTEEMSYAWGDDPVVAGFSTQIMRGDKVGIIGPNGAGKSTLLKLLLGELQPDSGSVRIGTNIEIAYFDQLREQLDEESTVLENIGEGNDSVVINGTKKHILGYLQDFLFTPERARTKVRFLSGGERNRILLARLFAKPANLLVMDEPTNDLDYETLELLEEKLVAFSGTLLLVSHDRQFINNVVSSCLVFEQGNVKEYVGGYDDWVRQRPAPVKAGAASKGRKAEPESAGETGKSASSSGGSRSKPASSTGASGSSRKLKYKEKRELDELPAKIESLESEIAVWHSKMAEPDFYKSAGDEVASATAEVARLQKQLDVAYQRWEELEAIEG